MEYEQEQFNQDQMQYHLVMNAAEKSGKTIAHEYCQAKIYGPLRDPQNWNAPYEEEAQDAEYSDVDLFKHSGKNPLASLCEVIAAAIQFPINTTFLHGIGVVSSAMNMNFRYNYHGSDKPANLYIVTAQPPSTGKSGIHDMLVEPVRKAYEVAAKTNRTYRAESEHKLSLLEKELAASGGGAEVKSLVEKIEEEQEFLASKPDWTYAVDDATPEALEALAGRQDGLFNVISDEADAISVLMGDVYSKSGKTNHGIFLKGWDGGFVSSARITRDTAPSYVRGTIAVIAQDESIDSILEAGRSGRGVSERILMLREKSRLGTRVHGDRKPIPEKITEAYKIMIDNIVSEQETVVLSFTAEAMADIDAYRNILEPFMLEGQKYSNRMITGVVGKADKQILKLASVLHVCDNWKGKTPARKLVVDAATIARAIQIFDMLINTFVDAADSKGFVGEQTELSIITDWIVAFKEKQKTPKPIPIRKLRDGIKRKDVFIATPKLTAKLRDEYFPALERRGILVFDTKNIYINPKL